MTHQELIQTFYSSFAKGNAEGMAACYHDNVTFQDPAFGELHGDDVKNMWRMLIERGKGDMKVTFDHVEADGTTGSANWIANYTFGQTGRKVTNNVSASFEFEDGKIIRHIDDFDMWKWSRQALGLPGLLLGWTPIIKNKVQKQTNGLLKKYTAKK